MTAYTAETLDLSRLSAAELVAVDFEATLAARIAYLKTLWTALRASDPTLPDFDTLMLESEPATVLNEEFTYSETLIRQAINDAAKQVRLAQAAGDALEHLTATYHGTQRQLVKAATETTPAIWESDEALRARAQIAPEALADFGLTPGGYVYKVRTAFADRIAHVYPINRGAGRVELRVLGNSGDGTVDVATLTAIAAAFGIEEGVQSTDVLTVLAAEIVPVILDVTLVFRRGPDAAALIAAARTGLAAYAETIHKIGATVYREAIASAAHVGPVLTVRVNGPADDIAGAPEKAPFVTAIAIGTEII
jgi:phage-related baseplate assembly protein